jgi:hypothetical protein
MAVANMAPSGLANQLGIPTAGLSVSQTYMARIGCSFSLEIANPGPGQPKLLWNSSFNQSRPFPGSNQLDVLGTTSVLINQSEFERTVGDLVPVLAEDAHEQMSALF